MAQSPEMKPGPEVQPGITRPPPPLRLSRIFHAPRETVFNAWSTADHLKRWFSPETYTVPDARVQMHAGGAFDICMRSPRGEEHWTRGTFVEVTPQSRLVIEMLVTDKAGKELMRAYTEVEFSDALGGTRMDVTQTYTFIDPAMAAPMVAGAQEGWRTTLDKLEKEAVVPKEFKYLRRTGRSCRPAGPLLRTDMANQGFSSPNPTAGFSSCKCISFPL